MKQQHATDAAQLVYPTVIAWPNGWDAAQQAECLSGTGAVDLATARLVVNRKPPAIVGCFDAAQSAKVVHAVRSAGGDAFAPSMADIATLGPSMKVKDLRLVDGSLEIDIWRGLTTTIRREHVQVLVRGSLRSGEDAERARRVAGKVQDNIIQATRFVRYGMGARYAAQRHMDRLHIDASRSGGLTVSEALDIHATNGAVFQIDGDKFAYSILGEMKGYGDKANMDQLCDLLAHVSPNEIVDNYFPLFRPPRQHHLLLRLVPEIRKNGEDPDFAFYSRWTALLYRHLLGPPAR